MINEEKRLYSNASELLFYLAKEKAFEVKAPIDVDRIAKELGILVELDFSLDSRNIVGEIFFKDETPIVKINPLQNSYSPRRRFTLAHEIGHYCLHSAKSKQGFTDSKKAMSRSESYWDSYESEANNFAAQLLMPQDLILEEGEKLIESIKKTCEEKALLTTFVEGMADKFEVSSKAMEYRLRKLRIIE
ncbi:ImmA/IrrE family metallo-endopeptidase [Nitrosococcus wardiae]|uniref:ImmA/IrrE family metallo-endopeptidase n=1 Tax=Nitrosococcus wardiae TaxID=1814290 RepID=A0A4P7C3H3_9GAMM|nr:ImmA/IrrE family metallo-endopeptidase [Nitrosococcus wardiae]QBQ53069.1 ImmA/IrrE family metallo-endopeptidase [Nitrosococcus wardiae]QBQ56349.1 ImmA/IrrE family metallo-endopeptidase [Nitrosococcus wardiae]QBQ56367.1 ImmA/IrrE family metallo-endopeptidase [Nitrosococcus wardiae]